MDISLLNVRTPILMVTHGTYGTALLQEAETLIGSLEVVTINVQQGEDSRILNQNISDTAKKIDLGQGILFLTDICGSTPANICLKLLQEHQGSEMITGLNLAMLIKLSTCDRKLEASALAQELRKTAQRSVRLGTELLQKGGRCSD